MGNAMEWNVPFSLRPLVNESSTVRPRPAPQPGRRHVLRKELRHSQVVTEYHEYVKNIHSRRDYPVATKRGRLASVELSLGRNT